MVQAADAFLATLPGAQRDLATAAFDDTATRQWIEYRPRPRPGLSLDQLDRAGRKAAHRLLATALSRHAYAQAATILALEEVLDREEDWARGRHSNDYYVIVFGEPARDERWGWRFEGHHLSVTMTVVDGVVYPTPIFLGANPGAVTYAGHPMVRPLAVEEQLGLALLDGIGVTGRRIAIVSDTAADDILSATRPRVDAPLTPLGVSDDRLGSTARAQLRQLTGLYLDRLPPDLAEREADRLHGEQLWFAWQGSTTPGRGHYYRIQGPDLLIEYDNTQNAANHPHSVLRRPESDFGGDVLAAHRARSHSTAGRLTGGPTGESDDHR
ncbi:MAG TPA: DUF3500 domain-containing protein [Micromonosporaceae bacterium]|nr:DUF3500 domain-containing protein [Micromonosporaceae bacterium]